MFHLLYQNARIGIYIVEFTLPGLNTSSGSKVIHAFDICIEYVSRIASYAMIYMIWFQIILHFTATTWCSQDTQWQVCYAVYSLHMQEFQICLEFCVGYYLFRVLVHWCLHDIITRQMCWLQCILLRFSFIRSSTLSQLCLYHPKSNIKK